MGFVMWLVFLILWFSVLGVFIIKAHKCMYSPLFWLTASFSFVIGLYYTSGFEYRYPLKFSGLFYFILIYIFFYLGYMFRSRVRLTLSGKRGEVKSKYSNYLINYQDHIMYRKVFFFISFFGVIIYMVDFYLHNVGRNNLHTESVISIVGVIGKILLLLSLVVWLHELAFAIQYDRRIHIFGYMCAIIYNLPAILTSGRQSLLIFMVASLSIYVLSIIRKKGKYKYNNELICFCIIVFCVMFAYLSLVSSSRQIVDSKVALFEYMMNCNISDNTLSLLNKMGGMKSILLEIISYYSHELPMFQVLIDNWETGHFWGMSQLQLISTNLPENNPFSNAMLWVELDRIAEMNNMYSHVWRTIAGNCFMDFGYVGGLLYMAVLGYISRSIYIMAKKKDSINSMVNLAILNAGVFFSMQYSPLCEGFWYYPVLWIYLGIPVINKLLRRR